jgi:ERCC4-type nuclease
MRHYSSLEEIRNASKEELASLPGMNENAASAVIEFFKGQVKGE